MSDPADQPSGVGTEQVSAPQPPEQPQLDLPELDDDGADSYSEYDSDEEEEEEEEEPKLKYQRIGGSVPAILQSDTARCLCANDRFLVIGTHRGFLHMLDVTGNEIQKYQAHSGPVNDLCLDEAGEHVASCSDDGTVVVTNLLSGDKSTHNYHRPVNAVSVHPNYEKAVSFACGGLGQQFIINTKGWFNSKNNVIHAGEGPIYAIRWRKSYIAWANDIGVKVYDIDTDERISYIGRPKGSPSPDMYRCHLCWASDDTLLIGWGDSVKIGVVKRKDGTGDNALTKTLKGKGSRYMAIVAVFQTDFYICGIAPYEDHLILLAYLEEAHLEDANVIVDDRKQSTSSRQKLSQRPELRIISRLNEDLSCDALPIHGFEHYLANDYRLDYVEGNAEDETLFYIVSPKDIVVAKPRDIDDHLTWLLARENYEDALRAAEQNHRSLRRHTLMEIGDKYLSHLVEDGLYVKAASCCGKLLGNNAKLWETWIYRFAKDGQLKAISPYIPLTEPQLPTFIYEMVLNQFIEEDHEGFQRTIRSWPRHLYNMETIIMRVNEKLANTNSATLLDGLGDLYIKNKQHDKALLIFIKLKKPDVFDYIKRLNLFDTIRNKVYELLSFNQQEAIRLLLDNTDRVPVEDVVAQLEEHKDLLHAYLHALFKRDPQAGSKFHQRQVGLYAEFAPALLLPFLNNSHHYVLEDALRICEQRDLVKEQVFILKRMGNTNKALQLIIEKLCDVEEAIAFVEEQKDSQLWEDLITTSLQNPKLLSDLLEHVGSHYVDPLKLIQRIPAQMEIPDLKKKLLKILSDCILQVSLRKGCNNILRGDCVSLARRFKKKATCGILVQTEYVCSLCEGPLFATHIESVSAFGCKHVYHTKCIESQRADRRSRPVCVHPSCQSGKKKKQRSQRLDVPVKRRKAEQNRRPTLADIRRKDPTQHVKGHRAREMGLTGLNLRRSK